MKYNFEILVTVSFKHSYFSNEIFGGLSVEPSAITEKALLDNGLLLKRINGGFHILYDTDYAGGTRDRGQVLSSAINCRFILRLNDSDFYNYTGLESADISKSIFHFSNTKGTGLKKLLHEDDYAGTKDIYPLSAFEEQHFTKPFAQLDLSLAEGLERNYIINFRAKETYWRYILMGEDLLSLNSPAIIESNGSAFFEGPEKLPVRGKNALAFRSKEPISFNQTISRIFQLVDNYDAESGRYKVVMRALPSANPGYITQFSSETNNLNNYSEIFIH